MLIKLDVLQRIRDGEVDRAYRAWARPMAKVGGRQRTVIGELHIDGVREVDPSTLTDADAISAGFHDRTSLRASLRAGPDRRVFEVRLRYAGVDPRIALRERAPDAAALATLIDAVARLPWGEAYLGMIRAQPATRAPDLAASLGLETRIFKPRVRRLKELGLTESLKIGYRLSPRGEAVLAALRER